MTTNLTREEFEDKAAAYALGAMNLHEVRVFEELISSFDNGEMKDLNELERTVSALAFLAEPIAPSSSVKDNLFAQINADSKNKSSSSEISQKVTVRADEGSWIKFEKGVQIKLLFSDPANQTVTTLLRMRPGSVIPRHKHIGVEQCYVISGDMVVGDTQYTAGDFFVAMPDTIHETITSANGGVILIVSPDHYEVV
jgi:quercetin dioxygenase-like cupin family protein